MSEPKDPKQSSPKISIFKKIVEMGATLVDAEIAKAKSQIVNQNLDEDFIYSKAITEDPSYAVHAAGWKERPTRLLDGHLRQMSQTSVPAAIIQTRQNQVARHSRLVTSEREMGWMLKLRDEEKLLEEIKKELQGEMGVGKPGEASPEDQESTGTPADQEQPELTKADPAEADTLDEPVSEEGDAASAPGAESKSDDSVEAYNFELERKARERLDAKFKEAKRRAQDYIKYCGLRENRPFETKKWNFDAALRAWVHDTMIYDRYATEMVPDKAGRIHHWFPIDGSTIKFASSRLKEYRQVAENFMNLDLLYPERQAQAMEKQKVLEMKDDLVAKDAYKYVQVIRGKIERAYTADELKLGIRNMTTDIYNNGYGVSELELCVTLITGHLNAEFYNQAYFTQGFSAKGILHIKAPLNRRKLETVRQQWQHMLRGAKNFFQTPIFAGMEDVNWIPLTQNHDDIGFEGWMRYLIKMICAIYQIDPHEIGIGFKDEGGAGGISGDNTKEKMDQSKDRGLYPLMTHLETYINENILAPFDPRFELKFCGVSTETKTDIVDRQDKERKFKKTVNEIRAEDGLPPLPGMDDFIAGPEYASWYGQFSEAGKEQQKAALAASAPPGDSGDGGPQFPDDHLYSGSNFEDAIVSPDVTKKSKSVGKARTIAVEYYKLED